MTDAQELSKYILGEKPSSQFYRDFKNRYSEGFDVQQHLQRIGVVNQTTMLASDTQDIADFLKETMKKKYALNDEDIKDHFADTRDTLCYATHDNQTAVKGLLQIPADIAIVVGGYNSSNTSHLVELCEEKLPTFFINSEEKLLSQEAISHYDFHTRIELITENYLPEKEITTILITSGASCPDALVEGVIKKLCNYYESSSSTGEMIEAFN
jgi:4-hydroxy-3-methylbut-2-enyl diphosphate reductase